jgi:transposase-like protein
MSILSKPYFHDEAAAFAHIESVLWANGRACPHCGTVDNSYALKGVRSKPSKKNPEGAERHGLYKCGDCRKQFTVRKGTIFEESHLPMHKWLQAIYLMCASKKGFSAHQMHCVLEVQYKTAWFLCHRIREAMRSGELAPMGGGGGDVEVDETFFGTEPGAVKKKGYGHKMKILSLVDRETKQARSIVVDSLGKNTLWPIVQENVSKETRILAYEAMHYRGIGYHFGGHETVNHGKGEYVRLKDREVHTNTIENYFSVFKRGMKGTYQHCAKRHLHRYMAEFDFRYNNRAKLGIEDGQRAVTALQGVVGKRLLYRDSLGA